MVPGGRFIDDDGQGPQAYHQATPADSNGLYVGHAQKKHEREEELRKQHKAACAEKVSKYQVVNLYIKNWDDDIDDDKLRDIYSSAGNITSAKVMRDAGPSESSDSPLSDKDKANLTSHILTSFSPFA
ncbi:MAG: hypothetical protein Q9200_001452 [Gallowayella weberi]